MNTEKLGTCDNAHHDWAHLHYKGITCVNWREQPAQGEGATCPTCGSDDKTIHRGYQCGHPDCPCTGYRLHECEDHWHRGAAHPEGGEKPKVEMERCFECKQPKSEHIGPMLDCPDRLGKTVYVRDSIEPPPTPATAEPTSPSSGMSAEQWRRQRHIEKFGEGHVIDPGPSQVSSHINCEWTSDEVEAYAALKVRERDEFHSAGFIYWQKKYGEQFTALEASRQLNAMREADLAKLREERDAFKEVVRWIAGQENLFFAECSQAEEIIARCKEAVGE